MKLSQLNFRTVSQKDVELDDPLPDRLSVVEIPDPFSHRLSVDPSALRGAIAEFKEKVNPKKEENRKR